MIVLCILGVVLAFISKESNFKIPIFGRIIRKCCFMAIDRSNPRKALPTIHVYPILEKQKISIFCNTGITKSVPHF